MSREGGLAGTQDSRGERHVKKGGPEDSLSTESRTGLLEKLGGRREGLSWKVGSVECSCVAEMTAEENCSAQVTYARQVKGKG